jgi:hypothetical protein
MNVQQSKVVFFVLLSFFKINVLAQNFELPKKIIISRGRCTSACGYEKGFHNLQFRQELEYNLSDSTFRYRKKLNNKFVKINRPNPDIFADSSTYQKLDSIYDNFTEFKMSPGKYYIFKIELIYFSAKAGLPLKSKTLIYLWTTNPKKYHPSILDKFRTLYYELIPKSIWTI